MTEPLCPDSIDKLVAPLLGLPAWLVRRGHGSFLTLEFGNPQLAVHDPKPRLQRAETLGPRRRLVAVHGQWHLWIYCCAWQVLQDGHLVATSDSNDAEIDDAVNVLDGQILRSLTIVPGTSRTRFEFDLGGTLATTPYNSEGEQWSLYRPDQTVLAIRADAKYLVETQRERTGDQKTWNPLWEH